MNEVDRIFLIRDRKVSNGEIPIILTEEESKRYKPGKWPIDKMVPKFPQKPPVNNEIPQTGGMFIPAQ